MTNRSRLEPTSRAETYTETLSIAEADTGTPISETELSACSWSFLIYAPGNYGLPVLDLSSTADVIGAGTVAFTATPAQMSGLASATYDVRAAFTYDGLTQEILRAQLPVIE